MKMSNEQKESLKRSEAENATFVPALKMVYPTSAVFANRVKDQNGNDFALQEFYLKGYNFGVAMKIVPIDFIGEGIAKKGKGRDKETVGTVFLNHNTNPNFAQNPVYLDLLEEFVNEEFVKVSLNHRVLIYIPEVEEFAEIQFSSSSTEEYTALINAATDDHIVEISSFKVPKVDFNWFKISSNPLKATLDPETLKGVEDARKTFKRRAL